jgi:predicted RNA-binding Zn-ribbon protein involved in translation (DUF1610 family)
VYKEPKIVLFDLETLPIPREVLRNLPRLGDYPGLTLKAQINSILCFGYKEFGTKDKPKCINAWDFKSWRKDVNSDLELLKTTREILVNADAIVTHNGKRFDWKFFQTRLLLNGLKPLPKIPHLDTCSISKKHLYLLNNKLDTLGERLVKERKLDNGGWDLWMDVMDRKPAAMKLMEEYCIQDVALLEKIFKTLRPFMADMPNYNLWTQGMAKICPSCGSTRIGRHSVRSVKTKLYHRYLCRDCGSWSRSDANDQLLRSF